MPLITHLSDRMIALELGHPILTGTPQEVISDPRVMASYLGGDLAAINRSGTAAVPTAGPSGGVPGKDGEVPDAGPRPRRRQPLSAAGVEAGR